MSSTRLEAFSDGVIAILSLPVNVAIRRRATGL